MHHMFTSHFFNHDSLKSFIFTCTNYNPCMNFQFILFFSTFDACSGKSMFFKIVAAFRGLGMHVSPAKQRFAWLPKECDYWTDGQTDSRQTKWSLCAAMLRRQHKNAHFMYDTCVAQIATYNLFAENKSTIKVPWLWWLLTSCLPTTSWWSWDMSLITVHPNRPTPNVSTVVCESK